LVIVLGALLWVLLKVALVSIADSYLSNRHLFTSGATFIAALLKTTPLLLGTSTQ